MLEADKLTMLVRDQEKEIQTELTSGCRLSLVFLPPCSWFLQHHNALPQPLFVHLHIGSYNLADWMVIEC